MIAAALLGICVVTGITAWDTTIIGAREATRKAWAICLARGEADAVLAAPYQATGTYGLPDVSTAPAPSSPNLQSVTVAVHDPQSGTLLYKLVFFKATELSAGTQQPSYQVIQSGCPRS